jgi:hypothetical protein
MWKAPRRHSKPFYRYSSLHIIDMQSCSVLCMWQTTILPKKSLVQRKMRISLAQVLSIPWQHFCFLVCFSLFALFVSGPLLQEAMLKAAVDGLQYARHEAKNMEDAVPFSQQLRTVFKAVRGQRQQAESAAAEVSRAQLLWDGGSVQHARFVELLERNHAVKVGSKHRNSHMLRLMNLEAERMLRSSAGCCTACARIVSVKKLKEFGKEDKDDAVCPMLYC